MVGICQQARIRIRTMKMLNLTPLLQRSLSWISCKYWLWFNPNSITFSSNSRCFCSGENLNTKNKFKKSDGKMKIFQGRT